MGMFACRIMLLCLTGLQVTEDTTDCGVNCLFVAVLSQDPSSEVKLDELRKMLRPGPDGNSLKELEVAAGALGMNTQPVRTTLDSLVERKPPFAFIAHLKQGHFVLFTDVTETTVSIADPPKLRDVNRVSIATEWDGTGLLISAGDLESEEAITNRLWWRHLGMKSLIYGTGSLILVASLGIALRVLRNRRKTS